MVIKDNQNENKFMLKTISLYDDDLIFLDVLPELNPGFIEEVRKTRQVFPQTKFQNDVDINK